MAVNLLPFNPITETAALTVTATSARVELPSSGFDALPNMVSVRVVNIGTNPVFVTFGSSTVTAAIPTSGNTGSGVMLLPNTEKVFLAQSGAAATDPAFSTTAGVYIAAIAASTGNTIYVTVGESV